MKISHLKIPTIVLAVTLLVVGVSGGAVAAKLITGKDIKDGSLTTSDIKNGTLTTNDIKKAGIAADRLKKASINTDRLKNGAVGPDKLKANSVDSSKIKDGTVGSDDLSTSAKSSLKTTYAGPNWSIVDRNVIGNGDAFVRSGPTSAFGGPVVAPPLGIGSLGIRTGSGTDKAAFGNEVDFQGLGFAGITTLGYSAFTTTENITAGGTGVNLPSLEIEIDPNLAANATNFSTAVFLPAAASNVAGWNTIDTVTTGQWFLTGAAGTATSCTQATTCTFAALQAALADGGDAATIFTVEFSKGRDFAYSGAVDALKFNTDTYDFEPFGVTKNP
jgi:hypothetical protein